MRMQGGAHSNTLPELNNYVAFLMAAVFHTGKYRLQRPSLRRCFIGRGSAMTWRQGCGILISAGNNEYRKKYKK
jgi:hypothetical protein